MIMFAYKKNCLIKQINYIYFKPHCRGVHLYAPTQTECKRHHGIIQHFLWEQS
jgi:hypothetical protein